MKVVLRFCFGKEGTENFFEADVSKETIQDIKTITHHLFFTLKAKYVVLERCDEIN